MYILLFVTVAKPKEDHVDLIPPRLVAEAPLLSRADVGPEMATVGVDVNLPRAAAAEVITTQTDLPELEEDVVPCTATQTDAPFTSRPNKTNLRITQVYDTKDEKYANSLRPNPIPS